MKKISLFGTVWGGIIGYGTFYSMQCFINYVTIFPSLSSRAALFICENNPYTPIIGAIIGVAIGYYVYSESQSIRLPKLEVKIKKRYNNGR